VLTLLYKLFYEIHLPSEGMPQNSCLSTAEISLLRRPPDPTPPGV
jgi:hypothetical protein